MQWGLRRNRAEGATEYRGQVEILLGRDVVGFMVEELLKDPSVEEGGKYVGYFIRPGDPLLATFQIHPRASALAIVDFLPSGPKATRTAVELLPDGPYQEGLFRTIEQRDGRIEHLGTWHSHHCNGLRTLSPGDVQGYFKTVNKRAYNVDLFLASLVKDMPIDAESSAWIDHFLFVRGDRRYYSVTDRVRLVDWPTPFGDITGHRFADTVSGPNRTKIRDVVNLHEAEAVWFETDEGRSVLAADKRFFDEQFQGRVKATRRDSQITLTGWNGAHSVAVTYPRDTQDDRVAVTVKDGEDSVVQIEATLSRRKAAFRAALASVQHD